VTRVRGLCSRPPRSRALEIVSSPSDQPNPAPAAPPAARRDRLVALGVIALTALLGVWAFWGLSLRTDLTDFVPESDDVELAAIAREVTDSEIARTSILSLGPTDDPHLAASLALAVGRTLADEPAIAWVRTGPPEDAQSTFYELYFSRRFAFAARDASEARALTSEAGLEARVRALRGELTGPTAMLVRRIAPEDPLLLFPALLRGFAGGSPASDASETDGEEAPPPVGLDVVDGAFVARERDEAGQEHTYGIVMLASRGTTFRAEAQEPVLAAIDRAFEAARAEAGEPAARVTLTQAGVARFAVRTERALRDDTSRISTLSTVAIVVLFLVLFRGPRYLLLGAIPLGVGTVASVLACRLFFGSVHAITLAFGSSLLGVGIDFISHYTNQHVLDPKGSAAGTMAHIRPGLALGALTTVAGLAGLGASTLPGMREIAVFSAVGVGASLAATLWLVPPFMPEGVTPTAVHRWLARSQTALFDALRARPLVSSLLPIAAVIVCAAGLPQLAFVDDLRRMNEIDPALAAEDRLVRSRVAQGEAGRFVMAMGADDESALVASGRASAALEAAVDAGELTRFRSITPFLRSAATQREIDAVFRDDRALATRLRAVLEREGFVASMFGPFEDVLAGPPPAPLDHQTLLGSSLGPLVSPFRVEVTDRSGARRVAYLAFVEGVRAPEALATRLGALEGVRYFDQARYLEGAYRSFRERAFFLVVGGVVVVFLMCLVRYRRLVLAFAAVAPALLASLTSLALVALLGGEANLMHLVACLLVLSMGEDYAVFLLEERDAKEGPGTTMVGILLACVTTVLSFGLLAMSAHPALRALGFVTSVGVGLAFVLAPLSLVLARAGASR
jgi:predicted exporter